MNVKKIISSAFIFLVIIVIAYEGLLFWFNDFNSDFNSIDSCVDNGGHWDYEDRICRGDRHSVKVDQK